MHVLCAPPAFLLSQDQTLKFDLVVDFVNFIFCSHLSENFDSFLVLSNSGYLLYCIVLVSIWLFDRNTLGFSYFSLFTFQCTLALSFRVLLYYTKCIILCQHFFETFLKTFLWKFLIKYLLLNICFSLELTMTILTPTSTKVNNFFHFLFLFFRKPANPIFTAHFSKTFFFICKPILVYIRLNFHILFHMYFHLFFHSLFSNSTNIISSPIRLILFHGITVSFFDENENSFPLP